MTNQITVADVDFTFTGDYLSIEYDDMEVSFDESDIKNIVAFLTRGDDNARFDDIEARLTVLEVPKLSIMDEIFGTTEPRVYHGFRVGERVRDSLGSEFTVVEKPATGFGSGPQWVPIKPDGGQVDGHLPENLTRVAPSFPDGPSGATDAPAAQVISTAIVEGLSVRFEYRGIERRVAPVMIDTVSLTPHFEGEYANGDGYRRFNLDHIEGPVLFDA